MSTISVSNITTANGSENLTISTGNNSGPTITMYTNGSIDFAANTVNGAGISTGKAIAMAIVFG